VVPAPDSGSSPTIVRNKISESLDTRFHGYDGILMGPVPEFLTSAFTDGESGSGRSAILRLCHRFAML
jgi:hypothetical protein